MKTEFQNNVWTEDIVFYLAGVSFIHKYTSTKASQKGSKLFTQDGNPSQSSALARAAWR